MKITDVEVLDGFQDARENGILDAIEHVSQRTGQPYKVALRATERCVRKGLIDSGVSLRTGWLTERGFAARLRKLVAE